MKRQDFTYRIIKVGKTAMSIAVCGLLATLGGGAVAETFSVAPATAESVSKVTNTNSFDLIYNTGGYSSYNYGAGPLTLSLGAGVNISGETVTGSPVAAFFTRDTRSGAFGLNHVGSLSFGTANTTLNLAGNNDITGVVGLHMGLDGNNWVNNYNSYTADVIDLINVNGTSVVFNNAVNADRIEINQGGTLQFYGNVDGASTTTIDYNGHNASVTLHDGVNVDGSIVKTAGTTNGSLTFTGAARITGSVGGSTSAMGLVEVQGAGKLVQIDGNLSADKLNYSAQTVVTVAGDLLLNVKTADGAINSVNMNDHDGVLQIGSDIVGVANKAAVTTTLNGTGTVTLLGGTQTVTGHLGQSGLSLRQLNVGGAYQSGAVVGLDGSDNIASSTTITGNVYATNVALNNATSTDSILTMASGYSITGAVVTEDIARGTLTMDGGIQSVTGMVGTGAFRLGTVNSGANGGTTTFTGDVFSQNVTNTTTDGTGISNFNGNVTATNINVNAGTSNFAQSVTATTTTIGTGTGNFNTAGGTTSSNLVFSGAGTANLHQGIAGNVNYAGRNATVNVWDGETITGAVTTTTTNNTGILNYRNSGVIDGTVGANGMALKELNINTNGANAAANGQVNAKYDLFVDAIQLQTHTGTNTQANEGVLTMNHNADITASTVRTTDNNTGSLRFNGTSVVTGAVGTSSAALKDIQVGLITNGSTVTFNNKVHATELTYTPLMDTTVVLNDTSSGSPLVGTVNFNSTSANSMKLNLGSGVNLVTADTSFKNANDATLRFLGNGTVTGNLGNLANTDQRNLADIYAGAAGTTVTFGGDVYVSGQTLHVYDTGVVNLQGNLNGPLVYEANGSVNVGDGKVITGTVRTLADNSGTLNFVGGTTTTAPIGEVGLRLATVGFHAGTTDSTAMPLVTGPVRVNIGADVFANNTFIGNETVGATAAYITATGKHLGTNLTLASNTTLNTAGAVTTALQAAVDSGAAVSQVDFVHNKYANGTINPTANVTQSTTGSNGTGTITTDGATLNFAVGTTAWADPVGSVKGAGGTVNLANSSRITGGEGSTLVMNGSEKVNLSLLGSLANNQSYTLINVEGGYEEGNTALPPLNNLKDNSFVIDTRLSRANGDSGDLVVTAERANTQYITKSATTGHLSNPAALRLGTLAAAGSDYQSDMQTVLNMLDIDQWGYGNNQANLAKQVKRLAPVANNSVGLSAVSLGSMSSESIGMRLHELRNVPQRGAYESTNLWIKNNILRGNQEAIGDYDGYKSKLSSFSLGVDSRPNNSSLVGAALSYGTAEVLQKQFREGDQTNLKSWQVSLYGAYDFTPELFLGGELSFGKLNSKGNRAAAVGRTALFDFDGQQSAYKFDLGYRFKFDDSTLSVTPLLSLEGRNIKQDAYTETNAGDIGLNVDAQRFKSKQAGLGLRLSSTEYVGGIVVKPELTLMSVRERGDFTSPVTSSFIGDNTSAASFSTATQAYEPRSTKVALGVGVLMSKTSSMMVRYQHVKKDTSTSNMAELTARWDF